MAVLLIILAVILVLLAVCVIRALMIRPTAAIDAKFYKDICDNCIRFAPLYIDSQQYGSVHGLNENIYQGALPYAVDFYKEVIRSTKQITA